MSDVRLRLRSASAAEPDARPFVDVVFERVGARRGARLLAFIQAWGVVADELGRAPTADEYAARFKLPPATAYRDQALFRDTFRDETPEQILRVIWNAMRGRRPRHVLSASVVLDLEAPPGASPVAAWFVAALLDRLPAGAAAHVDRAVPPLADSTGDRRTEIVRASRLADRAVFTWANAALARAGEDTRRLGLASLERFTPFDTDAAAVAAVTLRGYLDEDLDEHAAPSCLAAAEAAEAAADLRVRARGHDGDRLAAVGCAAATALRTAFAAAAVTDVVTPAVETVEELLALAPAARRRLSTGR